MGSSNWAAKLFLPKGVAPTPNFGPELVSNKYYYYGNYEARIKTANCSDDPNAGVVSGFFTYFNDGTDKNGNKIPDNSEIDFEWLCAEPNVIYLTMYTDYRNGIDLRKVTREIDIATGEVKLTCYELSVVSTN